MSDQPLTGAALARWCYENPNQAATTIEGLRGAAQAGTDLIRPDVLMNIVNAKINDYVELHNRGDLTEHGDHAWLAMTNLRRDLEFALKGSVVPSTTQNSAED